MSEFNTSIDYYAALGVPPQADERAITRAYHQLAARYHPDRHQGHDLEDLARDKLVQLNDAHRVLSNVQLRAAYDEARRNSSFSSGSNRPSPSPARGVPTGAPSSVLRQIVYLIVGIAALFLSFRAGPRTGLIFAAVFAAAWFGPRILKYFRRR